MTASREVRSGPRRAYDRMPVDGQGREVIVVRTEAEAIEDDMHEFTVWPEEIVGRWGPQSTS